MSVGGWNTVLVLGGIRSGKSEFAESLLGDASGVTYVATAAVPGQDGAGADPEWAARIEEHRQRRPASWATIEVGAEPLALAALITEAKPDETLLVDDLGGWVTELLGPVDDRAQAADPTEAFVAASAGLVAAVRACAGRLVLVSPEVGLSVVPPTPAGQLFADFLGVANRAIADACDAVVIVVAGQPVWLKEVAEGRTVRRPHTYPTPSVVTPAAPVSASVSALVDRPATTPVADVLAAPTMTLPVIATGLVIQPGMDLPLPDEDAPTRAQERLLTLDVPGAGLGALDRVISFAAAVQGRAVPAPWRSVRVLLLHGEYDGGASAGATSGDAARRADQARAGDGPLATLAGHAGASLQVVDTAPSGPIEHGPALGPDEVENALQYGWRLAEEAAGSGIDLLVIGSTGAGAQTAAAAVVAANTGAEPVKLLGRVITPGGQIDDNAWMVRCAAVRDALHRIRSSSRGTHELLAELGGGVITVATGILLGAAARRTPVLLDGPVGTAAGLVARELAGQTRHWCLLPDHGQHPTTRHAADVLGLTPILDLRLDLGEGANALATLPLLQSTLSLASALPQHPALLPPAPPEPPAPSSPPEPPAPAEAASPTAPPAESPASSSELPEPNGRSQPEPNAWPTPATGPGAGGATGGSGASGATGGSGASGAEAESPSA